MRHQIAAYFGKTTTKTAGHTRRKRSSRPVCESLEGRQLLTAGYFDTSFNQTGKALVDFGPGGTKTLVEAEAIQSDGKIVVAGEIVNNTGYGDIGVARFNSNGTLDTTFGISGRSYLSLGSSGTTSDRVSALTIDSSGRILLAGTGTLTGGSPEIITARLTSAGSFDQTYGIHGLSYADFSNFGAKSCGASGMVVDAATGKILVTGPVQYADGHHDFGVIRLTPNGSFDTTFGSSGRSDAGFNTGGPNDDYPASMTVDSFGRIVVAGTIYYNGQQHIGVDRLTPSGFFDNTFGVSGRSMVSFAQSGVANSTVDSAAAVAIDPQGRVVIAGSTQVSTSPIATDFGVARLTPDGYFDNTFGINGRSYANFAMNGATHDTAKGMAIDGWGRIIVTGSIADAMGNYDAAVIRLMPTGSWDNSFGIGGKSDAGFNAGGGNYDIANAVALDANGKIVLAGGADSSKGFQFAVSRIDNGAMNFNPYQITQTNPSQTSVGGALYTDVIQGGAETCWIDASIAALASKGVDLSQRIHYQGNHWYTVDLYDRNDNNNPWTGGFHAVSEWVYFDGTRTDADVGFDPAQPGECWTVILQRGIIEAVAQYDPSQTITNPHSGGAGDAMSILTGSWITEVSPTASNVQQTIINDLAAHKNITLHTIDGAPNLVGGHWYGVLSANAQGITLYNPWGILVTVSWSVLAQNADDFQLN